MQGQFRVTTFSQSNLIWPASPFKNWWLFLRYYLHTLGERARREEGRVQSSSLAKSWGCSLALIRARAPANSSIISQLTPCLAFLCFLDWGLAYSGLANRQLYQYANTSFQWEFSHTVETLERIQCMYLILQKTADTWIAKVVMSR